MQQSTFTSHLRAILEEQQTLDRPSARDLLQSILRGDAAELQIAALLGALAARGETAAEIAGFVDVMRSAATPYPDLTAAERAQLVDTCGTGGDSSNTFNISTAAALVAAAAGATVAKHGNRAVTSKCGSADVLEALGIPIHLDPAAATAALRAHRFCFLLAPAHHPQMKALMPVRKALGVRTVLHILGPLLNPAGARRQVMGVYHPRLVPLVAEAMTLLGTHHAMVVHGDGGSAGGKLGSAGGKLGSAGGKLGIDEISLSGPSQIAEVRDGVIHQYIVTPEELGLTPAPLEALTGGDATLNAAILTAIFQGEPGPRRDVVLLNAAAVLVTSGIASDMSDGIAKSALAIDSGATSALVRSLAASS
jgi:anthranilate phosphoribosyltransferase